MNLQDIQAAMEEAARSVATLSPDRWAGWAIYLLEVLESDGGAGKADFRLFLESLQADVTTRLEVGRW